MSFKYTWPELISILEDIKSVKNPLCKCGTTAQLINGYNYTSQRWKSIIYFLPGNKSFTSFYDGDSDNKKIKIKTLHKLLDKYGKLIIDVSLAGSDGHIFTLFKTDRGIVIIDSFVHHYSARISSFNLEYFVDLINSMISNFDHSVQNKLKVLVEWFHFWEIYYTHKHSDEYLTYWLEKIDKIEVACYY